MELYTKERIRGIFILALINKGKEKNEAEAMINLRPNVLLRVVSIQTKYIQFLDFVDDEVIYDFLCNQMQLDKLINTTIDQSVTKIMGSKK